MNTLDPIDELQVYSDAIEGAGLWQRAGMFPRWPLNDAAVVELVTRGGEYTLNVAELDDLVQRGLCARPGVDEDGAREWQASDVTCLVGVLEGRRSWQPKSALHEHKKHNLEILTEQARAAGVVADVVNNPQFGHPRYDVKHLVEMLVACPHPSERRGLAELLKLELEATHEVFIR